MTAKDSLSDVEDHAAPAPPRLEVEHEIVMRDRLHLAEPLVPLEIESLALEHGAESALTDLAKGDFRPHRALELGLQEHRVEPVDEQVLGSVPVDRHLEARIDRPQVAEDDLGDERFGGELVEALRRLGPDLEAEIAGVIERSIAFQCDLPLSARSPAGT